MKRQTIIELQNLTKTFQTTPTVSIEHLKIKKGEIYGFLGPNGAGKSTTMKMILSLIAPTSGKILVNGHAIDKETNYLNNIGSMIEEPSYYPNLTGYENLLVFQKMLGFDKDNIWSTLKLVGLDKAQDRKKLVRNYSLGMKQRLALAFALVKKPQILLLDEPTNGLDPAGIHEIRELIIKLAKEEGLTIFISSHILSEIEQVADRVGIINHGQLIYEGKIEEIKANSWIELKGFFNSDELFPILNNMKITVLKFDTHYLKIADITDQALAHLVRTLVIQGYSIYHVARQRESLENIFLSMTREDTDD